ncbi:hypothetical protein CN918_27975 [Priestia megaterium]|nr:hypothetical protein CN918_27975 [Priestia megaterium]
MEKTKKTKVKNSKSSLWVECMVKVPGNKIGYVRGKLEVKSSCLVFQTYNKGEKNDEVKSYAVEEIKEISVKGAFLDQRIFVKFKEEKIQFHQILCGKALEFVEYVKKEM